MSSNLQGARVRIKADPHLQEVFRDLLPEEYEEYAQEHKKEIKSENKLHRREIYIRCGTIAVFSLLIILIIAFIVAPAGKFIAAQNLYNNSSIEEKEKLVEPKPAGLGAEIGDSVNSLFQGVGKIGKEVDQGYNDLKSKMGGSAYDQISKN